MPQYTFRCQRCGQKTTVWHRFGEPHPDICQQATLVDHPAQAAYMGMCGGPLVRIFDKPNVVYRGSGFYATDHVLSEPLDND